VTWVKEIIRKEAHHRNLHEKDMCKCNEVHTEKERRRAREGAAERKKAKRGGNQIAAAHPDRPLIEMVPQRSADGAWSGARYGFVPQQSATGCWDGASYGTVPQQQMWENGTDGYYPQADGQWKNTTTENCQLPNGDLRNCEQQEELTCIDHSHETLKPGDFLPNIEQDLVMPLSTAEELAMTMISEQSTDIDDQGGTSDSDQSTVVGDQVNIKLEKARDLSPSPPVAVGSVTASRESSPNCLAVQKMATAEDIQLVLLKLSVSDGLDNAKGPS
jgi:hypothetical protein